MFSFARTPKFAGPASFFFLKDARDMPNFHCNGGHQPPRTGSPRQHTWGRPHFTPNTRHRTERVVAELDKKWAVSDNQRPISLAMTTNRAPPRFALWQLVWTCIYFDSRKFHTLVVHAQGTFLLVSVTTKGMSLARDEKCSAKAWMTSCCRDVQNWVCESGTGVDTNNHQNHRTFVDVLHWIIWKTVHHLTQSITHLVRGLSFGKVRFCGDVKSPDKDR